MKTNWQDPLSGEVISPDIAGLQEAVGKIEDALDMKVVNATDIPLEEIYISENDCYRIYQAPGKRNWVGSPAPVIKVNGTPVSSGFTVNYGGGAVVFEPPLTVADVVTADFSYVTNANNGLDAHLADYEAHLAEDVTDAHGFEYEEGTWTPILRSGTVGGQYSYGNREGIYVRTKNTVLIQFILKISGINQPTEDVLNIAGLPFIPKPGGQNDALSVAIIQISQVSLPTGHSYVSGRCMTNGIYLYASGSDLTNTGLRPNAMRIGSVIRGSTTYKI